MSSSNDELIAALPGVSDEQLEAWFNVVVKTKVGVDGSKEIAP